MSQHGESNILFLHQIRDSSGPQQRITRSLACHASVVSGDTL